MSNDMWQPHLHWTFNEEHVLLPTLRLESFQSFLISAIFVAAICLLERFITSLLDNNSFPQNVRWPRWQRAIWRSWLYGIATFLRLCYMLVCMTFHMGLLLVIVATLSIAQFFIELRPGREESIHTNSLGYGDQAEEPLLQESQQSFLLKSDVNRARHKPKPEEIFIHPTLSNYARADIAAQELGIAGETERVQGYFHNKGDVHWEVGKGKTVARELLGTKKITYKHPSFRLVSDSDSETESISTT